MAIKSTRNLLSASWREWGWGKRENSSFLFSLSRANEASALSNCRKKKKSFCGQAMFNHSYLQSTIHMEVSKKEMLMSVIKRGILSKSLANNPSPYPPSFRLPKYIVVHHTMVWIIPRLIANYKLHLHLSFSESLGLHQRCENTSLLLYSCYYL